jgi:hypothetical protein
MYINRYILYIDGLNTITVNNIVNKDLAHISSHMTDPDSYLGNQLSNYAAYLFTKLHGATHPTKL